jgi:hypothetical protein
VLSLNLGLCKNMKEERSDTVFLLSQYIFDPFDGGFDELFDLSDEFDEYIRII